MGLAAVCAGRRWPAREIATRELRSEWSISRPALALPPPTSTAPWPCRRPRAPQPGPPVPPAPSTPSVLVSPRSPARPRHRPRAPQPGSPDSPAPSTPVGPVLLRTIRLVSRPALALPPPTSTAAWPRHRPRVPWQVPRPLWHRGQARRSLRRSPMVCVFWIGSSVVDRNGASG